MGREPQVLLSVERTAQIAERHKTQIARGRRHRQAGSRCCREGAQRSGLALDFRQRIECAKRQVADDLKSRGADRGIGRDGAVGTGGNLDISDRAVRGHFHGTARIDRRAVDPSTDGDANVGGGLRIAEKIRQR